MPTSVTDPSPAPTPRRRTLQFSLRGLLIAMLLLSCAMAWLGIRVRRAILQQQSGDALRKVGAKLTFAEPTSWSQRQAWLSSWLGPAALLDVKAIDALALTEFSDTDLWHVQRFPHIKHLSLNGTAS